MTAAQLRFWARVNRRVAVRSNDLARATLLAFEILRRALPEAELARIIARRDVVGAIQAALTPEVFDRAFSPVRTQVRENLADAVRYHTRDLPNGGKVDGVLAVTFDHLSPNVITAIRTIETSALETIQSDVRETVRLLVEQSLREKLGSGSAVREIKAAIGLPPHAVDYVANLREELTTGRLAAASQRALLDQRFSLRALEKLSPAEREARIDKIVALYRDATIENNAVTVSRQLTVDAFKQGQSIAWDDAKDKGVIPDGFQVMKQWIGIGDEREREEHLAMNNEIVPADQPYSNGQMRAGEGDWNCRCLDRYFVSRAGV